LFLKIRETVAMKIPAARAMVDAGRAGSIQALRKLVKSGGDLNAIYRGYRPLHALIQEQPHGETKASAERLECLEWMLANGADPDLAGAWPPARAILVAAFMGDEAFVRSLKKPKPDGFVSAALGDVKAIDKLLPGFANARDGGSLTVLQCAAASRMRKGDHLGVARALLDAGADPNAKTKSWREEVDAIYFAASAKNRAIFELLLERGVDPTRALAPALWNGTEEMAEIAMRHGAAPDRATAEGQPLLNHLIRWGQMRRAMWLLERGANPNLADARGWTALHQAASRGNEKMVAALIAAGADLSRCDQEGNRPRDLARKAKIAGLLRPLDMER
jgi:ankyrin repeat protein